MATLRASRHLALGAAVALGVAFAATAFAQAAADYNPPAGETLQALQERMLADPEIAGAVQSLRDDPQVQEILADPAIAAALQSGDVGALLSDPRIKRLAEDPTVQSVTRQVTK